MIQDLSTRLLRFSGVVAHAGDYDAVLASVRHAFAEDLGACALLEMNAGELVVVAADGRSRLAVGQRRPIADETSRAKVAETIVHGEAEALVPLVSSGELVGALAVTRPQPPAFLDEDEVFLALGIAPHLAHVVAAMRAALLRRRWTSMLAHDFRSPIGVLSMNLDILRAIADENPAIAEALDVICDCQRSLKQLTGMTADLYDISRAEEQGISLKRERKAARAILESAVDAVRPFGPRVAFVITAGEGLDVECDVALITRVLDNILSNALRYAEPGTEIRVDAASDAAGQILFGVENDGRPLDPKEGPMLFAKYGETRGRSGRGLGLYFCRLVVEAHGGTIAVRPPRKRGARFEFALPRQ